MIASALGVEVSKWSDAATDRRPVPQLQFMFTRAMSPVYLAKATGKL